MEGGRRTGGASDGDEKEGAECGASGHADQHEQPCTYMERARKDRRGSSFNRGMRSDPFTRVRTRSSLYFIVIRTLYFLEDGYYESIAISRVSCG